MFQLNQSEGKLYPWVKPNKEVQQKPYCPPAKPYTRNLKVYYAYRSGNFHNPLISLSGKWLEDAGFAVGVKINVTVKDNMLVIEPAK